MRKPSNKKKIKLKTITRKTIKKRRKTHLKNKIK
jgi:hypothetical protein